jgi:hypothetical protein
MHPRTRELLDHLDAQHAALHATVDAITPEHRERRPTPDAWSVAETLEHLAIIERRLTAMLRKLLTEGAARGVGPEEETTPVVLEHEQRTLLDRSRRIVAPDAARPTGALGADDALRAVDEARSRLREVVLAGDGLALGAMTAPHPMFGPLNWYQWIAFTGGHQARHTAQIREAAEQVASALRPVDRL